MITVGDLRKALETPGLKDEDPVRIYLDLYCLDTHVAILRRVQEERNVCGDANGILVNVGATFGRADFRKSR